MAPSASRLESRRGATLVEMIVVITILGVISGFLFRTISAGATAYIDLRSRSANDADAHHALELMAREIQGIRMATSADIPTWTSSSLTFTDIQAASVAYSFSGATLTRNSATLLDRLQSFSFAYVQADGSAATATTEIWSVQVSATLVRSGRTLPLRTRVFPRNFTAKLKTWSKT